MFSFSKERPVNLQLCPYSLNHHKICQLTQNSLDFDKSFLPSLSIFYLMHIKHIHPEYSTLIFDTHGNIYRSKWSTSRLSDEIFNQYGYNYETWSKFLRKTYKKSRTIFPYIHRNHVYLKLNRVDTDHSDWLNLSHIRKCHYVIDKPTSLQGYKCEQIDITFEVKNNDSRAYESLTIRFKDYSQRILSQIAYSMQIMNHWYDSLPYDSLRESYSTFMANPAFHFFTKHQIPRQYRLSVKANIQQFLSYVDECNTLLPSKNKSFTMLIEAKLLLNHVRENFSDFDF